MTKITKREKILLFAVLVLAILYVSIQFALVPLSQRYSTAQRERDRLSNEKFTHEMAVANLPSLRAQNTEAQQNFDKLTAGYSKLVPNEETDHMLTTLCLNKNLILRSLGFATRPPEPPRPIIGYNDDGTPIYAERRVDVFTTVTTFVTGNGSYENMLNLLEEVSNTEYMRLSSVNFAQGWQGETANSASITLTFEVKYLTQ
ncbi:MAG: hypothetical protein FWD44_00535 [Oscillospiraceae bacterium]|nr:hypothetical protein [Oscillospiraceae bacterium]